MNLILASQSPRRRELLERAGLPPRVMPADVDETRRAGETPRELVARLAGEKAEAARARLAARGEVGADGVVVAADTIVWCDDGSVLGKPADDADAARMLHALSGRTHHVSTGVCALALAADGGVRAEARFVETTDVSFWELPEADVAAYVACGEPRDKAGAYGIQGAGGLFVRGISGDYANVVGLPVARLVRELARLSGDAGLLAHALNEGARHV